jgi:hypothetical protein
MGILLPINIGRDIIVHVIMEITILGVNPTGGIDSIIIGTTERYNMAILISNAPNADFDKIKMILESYDFTVTIREVPTEETTSQLFMQIKRAYQCPDYFPDITGDGTKLYIQTPFKRLSLGDVVDVTEELQRLQSILAEVIMRVDPKYVEGAL